jgi:hypothetical protein
MKGVMTWTPGPPREVGPGRRMLEVALCVAIWIGIGALINDGGTETASASTINWYLLIGIPIVIVFQLWVRRRPLLELWVREGAVSIARPVLFRVLFVAAAIYPAYTVIDSFVDWEGGAFLVFALTSIVGAAGFAYAYVHFDRRIFKYLAFCLGTAGVVGAGPAVVHDFTHSLSHPVKDQPSSDLGVFWISLLTYVPLALRDGGGRLPWLLRLPRAPRRRPPGRADRDLRLRHLGALARAGDRLGRHPDSCRLSGRHRDFPLDLVAKVGEPRRERDHPRRDRLGPQRERRHPVGRSPLRTA